jgi:ribulose 1,5-bisphosphate synthetase/thiazole synthase
MGKSNRSMPIYGEYDAIVSGGGVIGVVCAATLAQAGKKVALVERRSLLGWEIGRARRLFTALPAALQISPYIQELARVIADWPQQTEVVQGPVAELVCDRWVMEAGVDVLFHGWSSEVIREHGVVRGLIVGTREGYQQLLAPLVIETDDAGRLIDANYKKTPLHGTVFRSLLLQNTSLTEDRELELEGDGGQRVILRPLSGNMSRADITLTSADVSQRDREYHTAILEAIHLIRQQAEGSACFPAAAGLWR